MIMKKRLMHTKAALDQKYGKKTQLIIVKYYYSLK